MARAVAKVKKTKGILEDVSSLESRSNVPDKKIDKPLRRSNRLDPLTERLGQNGYFHKQRFEFLKIRELSVDYPLDVSRYYPTIKLAIDFQLNESEQKYVPLKEKLFKENGIKYFHIKDMTEAEGMIAEVRG